MRLVRRMRIAVVAGALGVATTGSVLSVAADSAFPFDRELKLDTPPMKGSKRVPIIEVSANGAAEIGLWCNTVRGTIIVVGDTITILPGQPAEGQNQCAPERSQGDEEMLSALAQMTNWRREGEMLILSGARTLRFRLQTN